MDVVNSPVNSLAAGSQNIFIEDGSKLECRAGMAYWGFHGELGDQRDPYWTLANRIHSKYDDFVNKQGVKIPLRVYYSGGTNVGDIVEAWLPDYIAGVAQTTSRWYRINAILPSNPIVSTHRYYWGEWYDSAPSVVQPELIFTYGGNHIANWSGGFAPITALTATTITTNGIWSVKGFLPSPEGNDVIVVNGFEYLVTGGFGTNTITVASTAGMAVNDLVFQTFTFQIPAGTTGITFDVCSSLNNQMYYEDWNQRNVYISWNRNQVASTTIVGSAVLDDLNYSGTYNGTTEQNIAVRIDSVIAPPDRRFTPFVLGDSDVIVFGGTHTGGVRDVYAVQITGVGPLYPTDIYRNGVLLTTTTITTLITTPYNAGNGILISAISNNNIQQGDSWTLEIGGTDTYAWYIGGVLQGSNIPVTTPIVNSGVTYTFTYPNGHTLGDSWTILNLPTIIRGWSNFSYTNPGRRPGQGFTLLLDSNGWTMKPQETRMLINSSSGHFYDVELKLSANLLNESVVITRLKSEPQNKVLFPYLINYIKNQLVTISSDNTFDLLGRQKFLELQQSKTLSDAVRIDFETVDWEDADVIYFKRKIYFNVPRTTEAGTGSCIFVYDDYRKYWHPPQKFGRRISLLSIIDNKLIGHSYERNESYELFTGVNDLELYAIESKIVMPYDSSGNRYVEKQMDGVGFEGYISGNPEIKYTINSGVGGCDGQQKGTIAPQNTEKGLCLPSDTASLGKSSLGFHGLGNDPVDVIPHFFYIQQFNNLIYYQRNIELYCNAFDQRWSIVSLGTSQANAFVNSESITDKT